MVERAFLHKKSTLRRLSETGAGVYSDDEDLRGWSVVDPSGEVVGSIRDLLIDASSLRVRFIEIALSRLEVLQNLMLLIPFDTVTNITNDLVTINQPLERLLQAPSYDPLTIDQKTLNKTYKFFGLMPFWSPKYTSATPVRCYV